MGLNPFKTLREASQLVDQIIRKEIGEQRTVLWATVPGTFLEGVQCAESGCVEWATVLNTNPRVHTADEVAFEKKWLEQHMQRHASARFCHQHPRKEDQ
jgi:hypothetical protein